MLSTFFMLGLLATNQAVLLGKIEILGTNSDLSGNTGKLNDGSPSNLLGGFGSALASGTKPNEFYCLPDRGPRDGAVNYPCRWHQVKLALSAEGKLNFSLQKTILLQDRNGELLQGLSSDLKHRFDPEGLRVGPWPGFLPQRRNRVGPAFYVSDEYQPKVAIFQQDGSLAHELPTPVKFLVSKPHQDAQTEEAQNKTGRQPNKGFEGLAIDPEAHELWTALQGPLLQDKKSGGGKLTRLVRFNLDKGQANGEFVYPLDTPNCGISEILWVGPGKFLVLERDSFAGLEAKVKRVYLVKQSDATDVSSLDSLSEAIGPLKTCQKRLLVDLLGPQLGLAGKLFPPKWEGMAWGEANDGDPVLWLISDNDFEPKSSTWVLALKIPAVMLRD